MSEAFCPNIQPRAHARLTGLTTRQGAHSASEMQSCLLDNVYPTKCRVRLFAQSLALFSLPNVVISPAAAKQQPSGAPATCAEASRAA